MHRVTRCQRKPQKSVDFAYALRSFLGYLEGTEKSEHTIKNYRLDLLSFEEFLQKGLGSEPVALSQVSREDLEKFHEYLKAQGLKTNTRRRKLLTVRKLLRYLTQRNKISIDIGRKLPAPHKVERIPMTVSSSELLQAIQQLPQEPELLARNRVLLWTLAETGCLVSEVAKLRFDQWHRSAGGAFLSFDGKNARQIPVSSELYEAMLSLKATAGDRPWMFLGFNKFGALGAAISPRGVELLVKAYCDRLGVGELTPRSFRHSIVLHWFDQGVAKEEIQKRLGLKTAYAFRVYDPIFKSRSKTTSTSETNHSES